MVPVSTAQTLPSLSSHRVWVSVYVQGGKTEYDTNKGKIQFTVNKGAQGEFEFGWWTEN